MLLLALSLVGYAVIIAIIIFALRKIRIVKDSAIFNGFALFGILTGFLTAFGFIDEYKTLLNIPGVLLGDEIYGYYRQYLVPDPFSNFARFDVPWMLRSPQIYLLASAVIWSLVGFISQLLHRLIRKQSTGGYPTLLSLIMIIISLCTATSIIYINQDESDRHGPTEPLVVFVAITQEMGWETINTWEVEDISLSKKIVQVGHDLEVAIIVLNTGPQNGNAEIPININGRVLRTMKVALFSGERATMKCHVTAPKPGTYFLLIGTITRSFDVSD